MSRVWLFTTMTSCATCLRKSLSWRSLCCNSVWETYVGLASDNRRQWQFKRKYDISSVLFDNKLKTKMMVSLSTRAATWFWPDCIAQCETCWATKLDAFIAPHESLWTFSFQCFSFVVFIGMLIGMHSDVQGWKQYLKKKKSQSLMLNILKLYNYNRIIFTRWLCLLYRHNDP